MSHERATTGEPLEIAFAHENAAVEHGLPRAPGEPVFANRVDLNAALQGFHRLVASIGAKGVQSWVSPCPNFPASCSSSTEDVLHAQLPPQARHKFTAFGGQPENFTSFLALKLFGPVLGDAARALVAWAQDKRLPCLPRYHFFADPNAIAADTDSTGVALVGLYQGGALPRRTLREGAEELLKSAALESLPAEENRAFGKDNGELIEGVFKVYWDDGTQDGRGRKHDPTCVANALHAVLLAAREAHLRLDGPILLGELGAGGRWLFKALDRRVIIERNIEYLMRCLDRKVLATGTRYYPSPDAFLCFASMLVGDFPDEMARLRGPLLEALSARWRLPCTRAADPSNPRTAINLAMRIIAAQNLGVGEGVVQREKASLVRMQCPDGAWPAEALFKLGSMRYYFGSEAMTTMFAVRALMGPGDVSDRESDRPNARGTGPWGLFELEPI